MVGVNFDGWVLRPRVVTVDGMILLHGNDDSKVSIGSSFLEVLLIYAHYDSSDFFLQVVYAFFRDFANNAGDILFLRFDCFLDRYGRVGRFSSVLDGIFSCSSIII